jgi:hypothetical protein
MPFALFCDANLALLRGTFRGFSGLSRSNSIKPQMDTD